MTSLIHLNGPPGIGKSTLSAMYARRHPGTLDLDVDRLHQFVGGWQESGRHMHEVLRPLALAMAREHLTGGRDVVLPQYLARLDQVQRFEGVALAAGAAFREVVRLDDRASAAVRFLDREDQTEWGQHNRRSVEAQGGQAFLEAMYDQLIELIRLRPGTIVITSQHGDPESTYDALINTLRGH